MEEYVIVNYIWIDENEITLGITNKQLWQNEIKLFGDTGGAARSMVLVTLNDFESMPVGNEKVGFYCLKEERKIAYAAIPVLLDMAWDIKENNLSFQEAEAKYFGKRI
jgi:hypothetical protein